MPEMDDDRIAGFVDQQLRYLRGQGPQPDLTGLTDEEQAEVVEVLEVVDALADSLPASPPMEEDPVAVRLGLVDGPHDLSRVQTSNPVLVSAEELVYRFGGAVEVEEVRAGELDRWKPALVCRSLAETALVVVYDANGAVPTAADARPLFRDYPHLSAVVFTSPDATSAAVVVPGDSVDRLVPAEGWQAPTELTWEPLGIALGRHFERSMPRWDEVASLPTGELLEDLTAEAAAIVAEKLREVASTRPKLPHRRHARDFVAAVEPGEFLAWVDVVRARQATGEELVSGLCRLCREESQ